MTDHKIDLTALTVAQLEKATGKTHKTIRKRLEGLPPVRADAKSQYYDTREALARIYERPANPHVARERLDNARAELTELKVMLETGRLVDAERVASWWEKIIGSAKQRLLGIPTKAAPLLLGCRSLPQVRDVLEKQIHEALNELAETDPLALKKAG